MDSIAADPVTLLSQSAQLEEDHRPVFTLWRSADEQRTVWVFQSEGGSVTQEAADAYFSALRHKVAPTRGTFVTLYDFTEPLSNFVPFALQLARNARDIRELMCPLRTVIVCTSSTVRNIMRLIIATVGGTSPYVLVENVSNAWQEAVREPDGQQTGVRDCYEGTSLMAGLDPALVASAAAQTASAQ